ncbi:MAG: hypothetical protein IT436_16200 [Phycisphaerales bacterium]|nr:hypothetical protein [Phycisphaerales bacterium]
MKMDRLWMTGLVLASVAGGVTGVAAAAADPSDAARAYTAELLDDAQGRTSAAPASGGFSISDGSGNYNLAISGWSQFRYMMNWRDNPADTAGGVHDSGFTSGFEATRTRLQMAGNVVNPDLKFKIEGEFTRNEGNFVLKDAWGSYKFSNGMVFRWGQFKAPLLREDLISDTKQLAVERSVTHSVFQQGRTQGVELGWKGDSFGAAFSFNDGIKTDNTAYTSTREADYGLTGRLDWKWAGDWKRFEDFTSFRGSDYAGMVGVAGHYQHSGNTAASGASGPASVRQQGLFEYTVDASAEGNGWNIYAAFIGAHVEPDQGDGVDNFGLVAQGGFFVTEQLEPFVRYDGVFPDDDLTANEDFHTLTVGANYYVAPDSHAAKFTADLQWFFDPTTDNALVSPLATGGSLDLQSSSEDNQIAIRLQFQLMF